MNKEEKIVWVRCYDCSKSFDERKVKTIDIESNFAGEDILTFECPVCKKNCKSKRWV